LDTKWTIALAVKTSFARMCHVIVAIFTHIPCWEISVSRRSAVDVPPDFRLSGVRPWFRRKSRFTKHVMSI